MQERQPQYDSPERESSRKVLDRFYQLQGDIQKAEEDGDFDAALAKAVESIRELPSFVEAWRVEEAYLAAAQNESLPEDWFRIRSIVSVQVICQLAPARRYYDLLSWLREQLSEVPQLQPWVADAEQAFSDAEVADTLLSEIHNDPGVQQAGLAKKLEVDGQRVRSLIYLMEQDGEVARRKSGRTYALYPPSHVQPHG